MTDFDYTNTNITTIEWTNGLFDCFDDIGTFATSCCCPCLQFANNKKSFNSTGNILPDLVLYLCGLDFYCCGATAAIGAATREEIRNHRNIEGSFANDCLVHCCCMPCALTQEKRELDFIKGE